MVAGAQSRRAASHPPQLGLPPTRTLPAPRHILVQEAGPSSRTQNPPRTVWTLVPEGWQGAWPLHGNHMAPTSTRVTRGPGRPGTSQSTKEGKVGHLGWTDANDLEEIENVRPFLEQSQERAEQSQAGRWAAKPLVEVRRAEGTGASTRRPAQGHTPSVQAHRRLPEATGSNRKAEQERTRARQGRRRATFPRAPHRGPQ